MTKQPKILATVPIDPIAHQQLGHRYRIVTAPADDQQTLIQSIPETVCLISRGLSPIDEKIMDASAQLRVIARSGAGYENIDIKAATIRGIPVVYAPLLGSAVAEATLAMVLALTKNLFYWHRVLLRGEWSRRLTERTDELEGKTWGIIGLGRIGKEVAKRAAVFNMNLIGYDPYLSDQDTQEFGVKLKTLDDLLKSSDVITIHAVATSETRGLIHRNNLKKIKRGAYIINFARGSLIENLDILYEGLKEGLLAGVGLDVFPEEPPTRIEHPLFSHPKFIGSPHILASTAGAESRCYHSMCRDILAVLKGEKPQWCVNPQVFELKR